MKKNIFIIFGVFLSATSFAQQVTDPISLDSFVAKIAREIKPQIIDARSKEEFELNHAIGAINFNLQSPNYLTQLGSLRSDKPVFIYSIANARSGQLAKDLRSRGFKEVYDLKGGIANWIGGGRPYYSKSDKELILTDFKKLSKSSDWVLVDIGSQYCGTCKKVKPSLDSLRNKKITGLKILEIDLEKNPQLIADLKTVNAFPYFLLYKQGNIVAKGSGLEFFKTDVLVEFDKNNKQ